jgi:alpha-beta hydrolase superfamily lysophospholipase
MVRRFALAFALAAAACGPATPSLSVSPSSSRDGLDGADGPFGAARVSLVTQARVSERVEYEVTFPSDAAGKLARGAPFGAVVLVSGGLVAPARYRWLSDHLATRGYVVISPSFALDLAFFQPDNVRAALRGARVAASTAGHPLEGAIRSDGPVVAIGHSLGGVVATWEWIDQSYDGIVLLASFQADRAQLIGGDGRRVVMLSGTEDRRVNQRDLLAGFAAFRAPKLLGLVNGMNHYDWTDNATTAELSTDGTPSRPRELTRRDALRVIDALTDAVLSRSTEAAQRLDSGSFDGITVQR